MTRNSRIASRIGLPAILSAGWSTSASASSWDVGGIEFGGWAETLFAYAMGASGSSCISCDFIAYFMIALTKFSLAVFEYFLDGFLLLTPVMMAAWIAFRVSRLMISGGEDGRSFIYQIAGKLALFFFVWGIATSTTSGTSNLWRWTGPEFLNYAFSLSDGLRDQVVTGSRGLGVTVDEGTSLFGCGDAGPSLDRLNRQMSRTDTLDFVLPGVRITCTTERTHMVGISTAVAIMFTAFHDPTSSFWDYLPGFNVAGFFAGLVKLLAGLMVGMVYAMSAVWLIFLTLDIVTRALVTSALSPLLGGLALFQPTRSMTIRAVKGLGGAMMTAVALTITSTLAFFLMTGVIDIYNSMADGMGREMDGLALPVINDPNKIEELRLFIHYIEETDSDNPQIPMNLATPWLYYLLLAGVSIFALGKKLIAMLEQMVESSGMSAFADKAQSSVRLGAQTAVTAGGIAGGALAWQGGIAALGAGMAGKKGLDVLKGPLGGAASRAKGLFNRNNGPHNPFGGGSQRAQELGNRTLDIADEKGGEGGG